MRPSIATGRHRHLVPHQRVDVELEMIGFNRGVIEE